MEKYTFALYDILNSEEIISLMVVYETFGRLGQSVSSEDYSFLEDLLSKEEVIPNGTRFNFRSVKYANLSGELKRVKRFVTDKLKAKESGIIFSEDLEMIWAEFSSNNRDELDRFFGT